LDYLRSDPKPDLTLDTVKTMHLLATESVILAGNETDPDRQMCLGVRNLPLVVQALGGTRQDGLEAAYMYQTEIIDTDNKLKGMQCFVGG